MKQSTANQRTEKVVGTVAVVGIDLAKNVFSLHGADASGRVVLKQTVSRAKLAEFMAKLPPCRIGMEACGGAHHWARVFGRAGHQVRIMAAQFVQPYRKAGKNDSNDAEAVCEALTRPTMRFVPVKTEDQQAVMSLHRVRQGFVEERTATINRLRGLLSEFGVVLPQSPNKVRRLVPELIGADTTSEFPIVLQGALRDLYQHLCLLDARVIEYDRRIIALMEQDPRAQRIQAVNGIGPLTASAALATVGDATVYRNGRQFAASIGLTPRQTSTGGKPRLGRITKQGDAYLRTLLIQGARSTLNTAHRRQDPLSRWIVDTHKRIGYYKTLVAIANKHARILWALLARNEDFDLKRYGQRPMTSAPGIH
ncbi:MAG: IS110 family transposase [Sulfuricaulis sp.]|uniref:IS110 family transposase n=1 Tax=Sulfuricaulis sp. TaxID=2003553 RepID=UPI0034A467F6